MYFIYIIFDSNEPAIRMNLALPEYGIKKALETAGFKPLPDSLYIGRKHLHFLSKKKSEQRNILNFNQLLMQNQSILSLCSLFGNHKNDGIHFHLTDEIVMGALIDDILIEEPGKSIAELQLIDLNSVEPLFEDFRFYDEIEEGAFKEAFYTYHQFGIESREFQLAKLKYLETLPLISGRCFFQDPSWHFYQVGLYYYITVEPNNPKRFARYLQSGFDTFSPDIDEHSGIYTLTNNILLNGSCLLSTIPVSSQLDELFSPVEIVHGADAPSPQTAFNPSSVFSEAVAFYVGQALMIGLFNNNQPQGFFDFGLPNPFNKRYLTSINDIAAAVQALITVSGTVSTIILSHTHNDHINMALQVRASHSLDWHIPNGRSSPAWIKINRLIQQGGGGVTLYGAGTPTPVWGNISIHKINTPASLHPHHNGIFAELTLSSGNVVLLPGDCILPAVAVSAPHPNYTYEYLQASHHGGVYFESPTTRNVNHIPAPAAANISPACYSYSTPNTHGHPSFVADYNSRNWGAQYTPLAPQLPVRLTGLLPAALQTILHGFSWI